MIQISDEERHALRLLRRHFPMWFREDSDGRGTYENRARAVIERLMREPEIDAGEAALQASTNALAERTLDTETHMIQPVVHAPPMLHSSSIGIDEIIAWLKGAPHTELCAFATSIAREMPITARELERQLELATRGARGRL